MRLQELSDGTVIDLDEIAIVGIVGGDSEWLSYGVKFKQGFQIEIYQSRQFCEGDRLPQLEREKLLENIKTLPSTYQPMAFTEEEKEWLKQKFKERKELKQKQCNADLIELFKDNDTGFMVIAALRYCYGRMTYAPSLMVEWVKKYWQYVDPKTQAMIRKEIESEHPKDMECDRLTWEDFAEWLQEN